MFADELIFNMNLLEKVLPWFALKNVRGVGNHLSKRLIDYFKSPQRIFQASHNELLQVDGMSDRLARAIKQHTIPASAQKELDLVTQKGYRVVTMTDPDFPPLLREIPDPPLFLYVFGSLESDPKNIAVVGSRNATHYGIATTQRLCSDLAALGITVVSGMAKGIDTAAHEGALMGGGKTIAVLGSGLENIYPAENRELFYQIAENGAVVSEFPLMTAPEAHNFPARNRIISGTALGTVIVEATKRSGSLITARLAADQGREVFAVPGSIRSFKSTGTHSLIKQGAKLVEHAQDVIEELTHLLKTPAPYDHIPRNKATPRPPALLSDEALVFQALEPYPVHIDDLVRKLPIKPGKLSGILLKLELKGMVQQSPGKFFSIEENFK